MEPAGSPGYKSSLSIVLTIQLTISKGKIRWMEINLIWSSMEKTMPGENQKETGHIFSLHVPKSNICCNTSACSPFRSWIPVGRYRPNEKPSIVCKKWHWRFTVWYYYCSITLQMSISCSGEIPNYGTLYLQVYFHFKISYFILNNLL